MASAQTIDIAAVLAPIPGDNPAGKSLLYTDIYDAMEKARKADDGLALGVWETERKTADWSRVIALATDALIHKGKDLRVAIRLVEALVKLYGFAGLRDGLRLLRELQEKFWSSFHPLLAEDTDLEDRAAPLENLNSEQLLPVAIRSASLTTAVIANGVTCSWLRWQESRSMDQLARQNAEAHTTAQAEGKITGEDFDKAVDATPRAFYETRVADLSQSREEYDRLSQVTDEKFGPHSPSLLNIKKAIDDCYALLERIVKRKKEAEPDPVSTPIQAQSSPPDAPTLQDLPRPVAVTLSPATPQRRGSGVPTEEPQDREDALRRLEEVARYFRQAEPHSPVSYLVQRAVQWGRMPLELWLKEMLVGNSGALDQIWQTLGLPKDADNGG